ncbi:hypothetical protein J6590_045015 [Homalodisca vitripennis]|nr:hypothetical protein J6590_045015 [Homalodisca vitripennis]
MAVTMDGSYDEFSSGSAEAMTLSISTTQQRSARLNVFVDNIWLAESTVSNQAVPEGCLQHQYWMSKGEGEGEVMGPGHDNLVALISFTLLYLIPVFGSLLSTAIHQFKTEDRGKSYRAEVYRLVQHKYREKLSYKDLTTEEILPVRTILANGIIIKIKY